MKTTAEQFRRLLPTLQHLARFPHCNRAKICDRDHVLLADVDGVINDVTEGSPSIWDEDCLAEVAGQLGVKLAAYKPEERPQVAPPAIVARRLHEERPNTGSHVDAVQALVNLGVKIRESRRRVEAAAAALGKDASTEALVKHALKHPAPVDETALPPAPRVAARSAAPASFLKACQFLLEDETLSEHKAATRAGCSSWSYQKKIHLGIGPIDSGKLRAILNGSSPLRAPRQDVEPKRSSPNSSTKLTAGKRRRLSKTTAAPAAGAAVVTREAAASAPIALGSGVLGELLERLVGGGDCTRVVGTYRLELNLRLVPVPADRSGA